MNKIQNFQQFSSKNVESSNSWAMIRDFLMIGAIAVVIILVGYLIYHNIVRRSKFKKAKS